MSMRMTRCRASSFRAGIIAARYGAFVIYGLAVNRRRGDSAANNFSKQCEERPMDFNMSDRQREWLNRVQSFMHNHVRPAVPIYQQAGRRGRALEGDPDPGGFEEEGEGRRTLEHVHAAVVA